MFIRFLSSGFFKMPLPPLPPGQVFSRQDKTENQESSHEKQDFLRLMASQPLPGQPPRVFNASVPKGQAKNRGGFFKPPLPFRPFIGVVFSKQFTGCQKVSS
ncbi:MAG: hypothetical protein ACO1O1_04020 [Adhaeribacter sp.]